MYYNEPENNYEPDIYDDIDRPKKRVRRKKEEIASTEYVNKEEMWQELYDYYVSLGDNYDWVNQKVIDKNVFPPISNKLTNIIEDISKKMGYRGNFRTYSWLDEMIGDAALKMVKAVRDCSFKCYTFAQVHSIEDDVVTYVDAKKNQLKTKPLEPSDVFYEDDNGDAMIKFKANPFGYFSRITSHSYINRLKKENELDDAKRAYQAETWEQFYANELFQNVRRPKIIEPDEDDVILNYE